MIQKSKIKHMIKGQLPDFIRGNVDYSKFIAFLEAYYEFLETQDPRNIESIRDIDHTLDDFIGQFKKEFDFFLSGYQGNERLLIRKIRDLYNSKGSEASYRLLFRLLFNKEIDIYLPSEQILKTSDGKWIQNVSLFIKQREGSLFDLVGNIATIQTTRNPVSVFVERVLHHQDDVYEVFISKNYNGSIKVGDILQFEDIVGTIVPTTVQAVITAPGRNFKVGQLFNISDQIGEGTIIKVTKVGSQGELERVSIIKFGTGYSVDFYNELTGGVTAPSDIVTTGSLTVSATDYIQGFVDSGYVLESDYFVPEYGNGIYVGEILSTFYTDSRINADPNRGIVQLKLGAVAKYPGFYNSNDGFLSDAVYLQDSEYYQAYSYVIKIDQEFDTYKDIVKKILHPAGTKMFGEYQLDHHLDLSVSVQSLISTFRNVFVDSISILEQKELAISKAFADTVTITDAALVSLLITFADSMTMQDIGALKTIGKAINDSFGFTDTQTLSTTTVLSDNFLMADSTRSFNMAKALSDTFSFTDNISFSGTFGQILTDSFSFSTDVVTRDFTKALADNFSMTDNISVLLVIFQALNDSFSFTDTTLLNITKALSDSYSLDDSAITVSQGFSRTLSDTATMADNGGFTHMNPYVFDTEPYFGEDYNVGKTTF
jgi:hypothetical protein